MSFAARHYRRGGQVLLAACDPELLGTKHAEGELRLDVRASFYDGVRVEEGDLRQFLAACTVANLVGERTVAVAVAMGIVESRNVRRVDGVPHAQMMVL
jgi:hypothetical protein